MQIQVLIHQQLSLLLIARQLQQELLRHSQERIIHVVIHQLQLWSDGTHTIKVSASDYDGNVATQKSVTFTVDTVPPELSVSAPVDNLVTNQSSLVVKGTTNDVTSSPVTLTIKLNGGTEQTVEVGSDGSFTKTLTLVTGENTIVITAKDGAGKTSTVTKKVVLDQTAPVIQSVTISPNPVNAGATYTISVEVTD